MYAYNTIYYVCIYERYFPVMLKTEEAELAGCSGGRWAVDSGEEIVLIPPE
jgi:hypothetical protein